MKKIWMALVMFNVAVAAANFTSAIYSWDIKFFHFRSGIKQYLFW